MTDYSQPQSDLALLRTRPDFYAEALPTPPDILLVIEVADTSLEYDRDVKVPCYAQAGIPEAWLVDVQHETITVYTQSGQSGYQATRQLQSGEIFAATAVAGLEVSVNDILG